MASVDGSEDSLRPFQTQVLELARDENVVMVGATGIGKTFVAIALLSELDYAGGKRAFFMAPTRQLVWQIAAKIRQLSTLRVNAYTGGETELWDARKWQRELALYRVLVCTPEVVRNLLEKAYVTMDQINVLVFDECHHVTKRHPYAQVAKMYTLARESGGDPADLPRIFGATACPTEHCASTLHARLHHTDLDEDDMFEYAAMAPVVYETYAKEEEPSSEDIARVQGDVMTEEEWEAQSRRGTVFEKLQHELDELKAIPVLDRLLQKSSKLAATDRAHREKLVRRFVLSCVEVYKNLGLWCFYKCIELEVERSAIGASMLIHVPGTMYGYDRDAVETLLMARARRDKCEFAATSRLDKLEEILRQRIETQSDPSVISEDASDSGVSTSTSSRSSSQGIIFVTTRMECRVVCEYLNAKLGGHVYDEEAGELSYDESRMFSQHPEEVSDPLFASVLGQAGRTDAASTNLPSMEDTLRKFETGAIPFLVSTAVSIEGVDFPQCSLIVVMGRVQTPRQFIQLRGRARHQDGLVYYLAEDGDHEHHTHYRKLLHQATAIKRLDFQHDKQVTEAQLPRSRDADSRVRIDVSGALLDLDSSISRLNEFVQSLPSELYTVDYKTMYTYEEHRIANRLMFSATLHLPVELEIEPITSEVKPSKAAAKAAAALDGCRRLLEEGQLDESLNSVYRKRKNPGKVVQSDDLSSFLGALCM
ncbi:hypothetical protein Poli38472_011370 [Pythium oligandrum]|uniref:Uncharacterized protein n=1 Tax=Pythium oligandrum TaxID=41045 RepID=A0A8K1CKT3_PYTOL|nr:hypothetical protein Poli38472_011370 [Pythium oligandrum]|eukprot:TMW64490.1 hypothetical protein Poli38472_011370 [Pythium oligandrum]